MTPARALSASCPTCGEMRIMLPVGQEPSGSHVRCPFCRRFMLEWRWIEGTAHTTHTLPYAERLGMTVAAEACYRYLVTNAGWRPQEARSVFPNALASRIVTTGNLRNWRHFFIMRTAAESHPQMRQVTIPLLGEFQRAFPLLFDDIVPNQKQSEAMRKAR